MVSAGRGPYSSKRDPERAATRLCQCFILSAAMWQAGVDHAQRRTAMTPCLPAKPARQLRGPAIILVEPQLGENIGMVARAMANFGLAELGWSIRATAGRATRRARRPAGPTMSSTRPWCSTISRRRSPISTSSSPPRRASATASSRCAARSRRRGRCAAAARAGQRTGILFGRERFGLYNRRGRAAPTRSSPFRSTRPSPRSTSRRPCC